jgi:hypothetical protein
MTTTRTIASQETDARKKRADTGSCGACLQSRAKCSCGASKGSAAKSMPEAVVSRGHDFSTVAIGAQRVRTGQPPIGPEARAAATTGAPEAGAPEAPQQGAERLQQSFPDLPGNPSACVVSAAMPHSRSGIKRTSTGDVFEDFEVRIEWKNDPGSDVQSYCASGCGEYHQFVKGYMKSGSNKDGSDLKDVGGTVFGGVKLDPGTFNEDGLDGKPKARYGHRDEKQTMNESFSPTREHGTLYVGKDSPGVFIGTFADFDLTFVGKLVDRCNGTETESDPWQVAYRGVIRP